MADVGLTEVASRADSDHLDENVLPSLEPAGGHGPDNLGSTLAAQQHGRNPRAALRRQRLSAPKGDRADRQANDEDAEHQNASATGRVRLSSGPADHDKKRGEAGSYREREV